MENVQAPSAQTVVREVVQSYEDRGIGTSRRQNHERTVTRNRAAASGSQRAGGRISKDDDTSLSTRCATTSEFFGAGAARCNFGDLVEPVIFGQVEVVFFRDRRRDKPAFGEDHVIPLS